MKTSAQYVTISLIIILVASCEQIPANQTPSAGPSGRDGISPSQTSAPASPPAPTASPAPVWFTFTPMPPVDWSTPTAGPTYTPIPRLTLAQPFQLANIRFFDAETGWGIGLTGHILRTADGGVTWQDVTPQQGAYSEGGFFALDGDTAWATPEQPGCYSGCSPAPNFASVWHTSDGGESWQEGRPICLGGGCTTFYDVNATFYDPIKMQFLDAQTGWLLVHVDLLMSHVAYRLYRTADGGLNWSLAYGSGGEPFISWVPGMAFLNLQTGWLGADDTSGAYFPVPSWRIYKTTEGGIAWEDFRLPAPSDLPDVYTVGGNGCGTDRMNAIPPRTVDVISSCKVTADGTLKHFYYHHHSADAGVTWTSWPMTGPVDFVDGEAGFRLVSPTLGKWGELQKTTDAGGMWKTVKAVPWDAVQIDFIDEQIGWALDLGRNTMQLLRTIDGGLSWQSCYPSLAP